MNIYFYIGWICWLVSLFVIHAGILAIFLKQLHNYSKTKGVKNINLDKDEAYISFRLSKNAALISLISVTIWDMVQIIPIFSNFKFSRVVLAALSQQFSWLALISVQVIRLYYSFKHTTYQISKYTLYLLILMIIITFLSIITYVIDLILWFYCGKTKTISTKLYLDINYTTNHITYWIIIIVPIICTTLFSFKLLKLVVNLRQSATINSTMANSRSNSSSINTNISNSNNTSNISNSSNTYVNSINDMKYEIDLSSQQRKTLEIVTKQTLLIFFQTMTFLIKFFIYIVWYTWELKTFAPYNSLNIIWPLCLWLSFIFANKQYQQFCYPCHNGLRSLCHKIAKMWLQHKHIKAMEFNYVQMETTN